MSKLLANTPWGGIEIADAHVHFFSPAFFQSIAEQKNDQFFPKILGWDEPTSPEALAMHWVSELDRHNIQKALLIASIPNDTKSVGPPVQNNPDRFSSIYMANPLLPSPDIRFQAAANEDSVSGIFLFPAMHHYPMHHDKVCALVQVVGSKPGNLVYVHCGVLSIGFRKKLGLPCNFDMRFSNPVDLHGLATRFPRVNFVIPHFGAGFFREALMVASQCPNVYLDTSGSNAWIKLIPEGLSLTLVFRKALDVLGPKRLLFGSDSSWFPRGWVPKVLTDQLEILREVGVDHEAASDILGGNLRRLLAG